VGMLAPFLPQHLRNLHLDERWSGIIFSFYPVAVILTTPLANTMVARHGRLPLIGFGLVIQALSALAFGMLGESLAIMLLSRFLQGCGASASNLAIFALVTDLFEESLGQVMGLNELFIGAGFSAGPLIGSLLFKLGGFAMPFIACGVMLACLAVLTPILRSVSPPAGHAEDTAQNSAPTDVNGSALGRIWSACTYKLLAPAGLMLLGTVVWGVIDSGFYTVHADHDLGLSQTAIGVNLAAASAAYSLVGPAVGHLADRMGYGFTMAAGAFISAGSLLLLGPFGKPTCAALAFIFGMGGLPEILLRWWEFVVLVVLGCGQAGMLIPSLGAMKSTLPSGDTSSTEACISLFNTFQQAGLVLGPWLSSALGTYYTFGNTCIAASILAYCVLFSRQLRSTGCKNCLGEPLINATSPHILIGSPLELFTPPGDPRQRMLSDCDA